ncbi:hypothetical protein ROZALSC1DRAFT_23920 [Rozella allomycis CSF55]|uniref:Uncharacterized protein n=1 Tax=Rozella allomycis (strain CSF55) TaxID=988480 RepID=A0A4P9YFI3_ROZAC|nr:hypothetical protein ROZALSC1DRAFT_23920 [Rozella allomycis CSF55]
MTPGISKSKCSKNRSTLTFGNPCCKGLDIMKTFFLFLALLQIHDEDHRNAIISELKALTTKGREVSNPLTPGSFTNSATYFFSTRLFDYVLEYLPRTKYYLSHNDNQSAYISDHLERILEKLYTAGMKNINLKIENEVIFMDHAEVVRVVKNNDEIFMGPFNPQLLSAYVKPANLALSKLTGQEIDLFPEESDPFLKNIKIAAIK